MSPYLLKELYQQIKRIIARPLAITNADGQPFKEVNDFPQTRLFILNEAPTRDKSSLSLEGHPQLQAIPLYAEDKLVGLITCEVSAEDVQTIQLITSLAELLIQQFMVIHKPRPDAVDLLLTRLVYRPATIDAEELEQQMAALGYRLDVQRCGVLFELAGFWDNYLQTIGQPLGEKQNLIAAKKHDIEQSLTSFFSKNQDNIIGYIGNDRFLVLKDLSTTDFGRFSQLLTQHYGEITDALKNIYIKKITVGIGSSSNSASDLILSVGEARQVLEIGQKLEGSDQVYKNDILGVLPLVIASTPAQKKDQAERILANLDDPELTETLEAFLRHNLNLTQTSDALKIHRNTVIYRLDKITEKIGKDPRSFDEAVELFLALQLRQIYA